MQGGARAALFNTQTHERQKIKLLAEVRAAAGSGYEKKSKEEAELEEHLKVAC